MDNLCHTLTGAAFAEAGLKHRTRFGTAALVVAANLPDIDVLAFVTDTPSVALRRGWTHGVAAQALLPVMLTMVFTAIDRWRPPADGVRRVLPAQMLLLSAVGILSHVGMDWLNTYGVRLLMPFSGRWFYGDAVFIIDPWLWSMLALGVILARRRRRASLAAAGLVVATVYIGAMVASAGAARRHVSAAWQAANGRAPAALMVGPVFITPFQKRVIVDAGDYYELGTFDWRQARLQLDPARVPKNHRRAEAVRALEQEPDFRALLIWSRFPRYEIAPAEAGVRVVLSDMRFDRRIFNAATVLPQADP